MMALYESEDSESLNETIVANGVARVASNADKLATSEVIILLRVMIAMLVMLPSSGGGRIGAAA